MKDKRKGHRRPPNTLTFPSFPAQKTSLFTLLYRFFFMYINKNTFIQVILEQFFSFFFVHKNYKKLQKAPLNRPVVTLAVGSSLTQRWSPPQNSYLIYLF